MVICVKQSTGIDPFIKLGLLWMLAELREQLLRQSENNDEHGYEQLNAARG